MFFPLEWLDRLSFFSEEPSKQNFSIQRNIDAFLVNESNSSFEIGELEPQNKNDQQNAEEGDSSGDGLNNLNQEKWGDLLERLEKNTGFKENYPQTYDDLLESRGVSGSYIHRDRLHEDIVVKDVFPTIHNIDQPFEEILKAAPEKLNEFEDRNEIIELYRSQNSDEDIQLVEIKAEHKVNSFGPLVFPPAERKEYFDKTLPLDKTKQLSDFIEKYFNYDPNEGDLPIATRELYSQNLERLLYTFSSDPTYFFLDFYLENLNKEDFLHNALDQAAKLDGSKTATKLLMAIERIYEIQQRAWRTYYDFESIYKELPQQKKDRLRIETLRRANARYKEVLEKKGIKDLQELENKYLKRRYEIIDHIIKNTPKAYRLHDALFEQGFITWQMGLQNNDEKLKQEAIVQWQSLIDEVLPSNFSEKAYPDFINISHLRLLNALIKAYHREPETMKAVREQQISDIFMVQRHIKRLTKKRERESRLLWPDN